MKFLVVLLFLIYSPTLFAATKKKTTPTKSKKEFFCPSADKKPTLNDMYVPLQVGTVWGSRGIVFVNEEHFLHEGNKKSRPLTWVGETFKRKPED